MGKVASVAILAICRRLEERRLLVIFDGSRGRGEACNFMDFGYAFDSNHTAFACWDRTSHSNFGLADQEFLSLGSSSISESYVNLIVSA